MGRLDGKVALVTGAARGIGKGIATELAKEGADVVIADLLIDLAFQTAGELQNRHGVTTLALEMDVTSEDSISTNVENAIAEMGRIDILVNNAGVAAPTTSAKTRSSRTGIAATRSISRRSGRSAAH